MKRFALFLSLLLMLCLLGCGPTQEFPEEMIETEYFTLPLPPGVIYSIIPEGDRFSIEFYEQQDYETNGTGLLCTVKLFKEGEDYTLPGHVAYGVLATKKADFQVVALYPAEVTYTPANANQNKAIQKLIDNMLTYDLEPKTGIQYLRPTLENTPVSEVVIETRYYTVKIPEAWVGKVIEQIEEFEDGTSIVTFYEKECYMTSYNGKICSIQLVPEQVEWSSVEDSGLFGGLKTPDGFFVIVGVFPEEKQYSKETYETYEALRELTPALFGAISPKEGCELSRA